MDWITSGTRGLYVVLFDSLKVSDEISGQGSSVTDMSTVDLTTEAELDLLNATSGPWASSLPLPLSFPGFLCQLPLVGRFLCSTLRSRCLTPQSPKGLIPAWYVSSRLQGCSGTQRPLKTGSRPYEMGQALVVCRRMRLI